MRHEKKRRVKPGINDLKTLYPQLSLEWDFEKNGDLLPENVAAHSSDEAWWRCEKYNLSWPAIINNRSRGAGCPYCSGRRAVPGITDFASKYPELMEEWCYEKNTEVMPNTIVASYPQKVWWKCKKCEEVWPAKTSDRIRGTGCPYCAHKLPIPGKTDLASNFPLVAEEWDYEKNTKLPSQVTASSGTAYWWKCKKCKQSWPAKVANRVRGSRCPFCTGRRPIPGKTDLTTLFPQLAAEWDYEKNEGKKPQEYTIHSQTRVHWKCSKCLRSWKAIIAERTKGTRCPYCTGKKVIPGETDLATLFPQLAAEWDYEENEGTGPDQVSFRSSKRVGWKCIKCSHTWKTIIAHRTRGSGCPKCSKQKKTKYIEV